MSEDLMEVFDERLPHRRPYFPSNIKTFDEGLHQIKSWHQMRANLMSTFNAHQMDNDASTMCKDVTASANEYGCSRLPPPS